MSALRPRLLILIVVLCASCSIAKPRTDDPAEKFNRNIYTFNDALDKAVVRPVAVGYRKVTTSNMRRVVNNFFANVRMPITIGNDILQGSPKLALRNTGRFLINTTLGFAGLFDPASRMRLTPDETDFGVTLAKWGVPEGPYLVLPLIGSTTTRDVWRLPVDTNIFDPLHRYSDNRDFRHQAQYGPEVIYLVTLRASAIDAENLLEGVYDPYVFYRDAYRQRRLYEIYDGQPPIDVLQQLQGVNELDVDQLLEEQQQYENNSKTHKK